MSGLIVQLRITDEDEITILDPGDGGPFVLQVGDKLWIYADSENFARIAGKSTDAAELELDRERRNG